MINVTFICGNINYYTNKVAVIQNDKCCVQVEYHKRKKGL